MEKRRAIALAAIVLMVTAVGLASGVGQMRAALAQPSLINVSARERQVDGQSQGEVLVGNQVVLRIRSSAGGLSAMQRANQVAQRLQAFLRSQQDVTAADFRVARAGNEWAVFAGDTLLITADAQQAALNGTTPERLARSWRDNIAQAVTTQVAGYRAEAERSSSKIVPIVSLGSGIRVGAAQITGPAANVGQASVVGQIETTFQDVVRIRIFVPLESITNIQRVPQVNVSAYGDIRL